ncbi:MAG: hypothetical protein HY952_02070 [Elusimicrobia bacterium]|nr:hypothetical protein [Elusimicrobiota bacterium]
MTKASKEKSPFRSAALLAWLLLLCQAPAWAVIKQTINYQGFLLSKVSNLPVEVPQDITFIIYSAASGGSVQFSEARCNVPVTKGRYDVEIGSMTAGGIPGDVFMNSQNLWLEIQIDPDNDCTGTYEALTPRIRLQASPYAFSSLYASTASAATPVFNADTIGALPTTGNGAITISTNLFVQGGISVGSISPGQKLSVAGMVESKGVFPACTLDGTCGFKFPDGSIQTEAAANTMWKPSGPHIYSINPGNVGIGENLTNPLARLHISTAAGDTGDVLLVTTGTARLFSVNGIGQVHGGVFYGDGSALAGVVVSSGGSMTGPLSLMNGSSLTVTSPLGVSAYKVKFRDNVEMSSASAANNGGIYISTHVRLMPGAVLYGDGAGLSNVVTLDGTKVSTSGATMSGPLTLGFNVATLAGSSLTVTGETWLKGNTVLGTGNLARLSVGTSIIAASSVTASLISGTQGNFTSNVTASTGTFWGYAGPDAANSYSVNTASGIFVALGKVKAPYFEGNGAGLSNVSGTDATRVLKAGDTMTGNLTITPSSVTIVGMGAEAYALTVSSALSVNKYGLSVSTMGRVGIQVSALVAPLTVYKQMVLTNDNESVSTSLRLQSGGLSGYVSWDDTALGASLGAMGYRAGTRDFVFNAAGADTASGTEVLRISNSLFDATGATWKFGIGITPTEKFHVGSNMLVSTAAVSPILYISTTTGLIGVGSAAPDHKLHVAGGIMATSSITAQGGFFGDGSNITNISAGGLPGQIVISSITARLDSTYAGVVITSDTYVIGKLAVGEIFNAATPTHLRGEVTLDQKDAEGFTNLNFTLHNGGPAYIKWGEGAMANKVSLGSPANLRDLVMNINTTNDEVFRIKGNSSGGGGAGWKFGIGTASPLLSFHVASDVFIGTAANRPVLTVSTSTAYLGISTGSAKEGLHVASSLLVGGTRASSALYVSTTSGYTGVGTGNPRALLEVGDGNILAAGTYSGAASLPMAGAGTRFMWMPTAGAIRAGSVIAAEWDVIGNYSTAFGYRNSATNDAGVVSGGYNNANDGRYAVIAGGINNVNQGFRSSIGGGDNNYVYGGNSVVPNGGWNTVFSSYSFVGGFNTYLTSDAKGTFAWGYDDVNPSGTFNTFQVTEPHVFLVDPANIKQYKVGVRTASPKAALDINGDAQFGAGVTKSTATAEGYFVPRAMTIAELQAATPSHLGAVVYNSDIANICFSTGTAKPGQWAIAGTKANCY